MHDCYSTTYPNGDAFHAWRAGFREGVKMCLDRGRRPTVAEFQTRVHQRNLDHLTIWHNIGADIDHGLWAVAGARLGTYKTMLSDWDYRLVQSFDALADLWQQIQCQDPGILADSLATELKSQLSLPIDVFLPNQSAFFKHHYHSHWKNLGIMVREVDTVNTL
jgi:hypothetical protein